MVLPVLLYSPEVWGIENNDLIITRRPISPPTINYIVVFAVTNI